MDVSFLGYLPVCVFVFVCFGCSRGGGRVPFSGFSGFLGWFPCVGHFGKLAMGWDSDFGIYIRLCSAFFF